MCWRKAIELDPDDEYAHYVLADALKAKADALEEAGGGGGAVAALLNEAADHREECGDDDEDVVAWRAKAVWLPKQRQGALGL